MVQYHVQKTASPTVPNSFCARLNTTVALFVSLILVGKLEISDWIMLFFREKHVL